MEKGAHVAGRFDIEALAGAGGMGTVYRALDRETSTRVALKLMQPGATVERFLREAALLATLRHPNVVGYVAHGATDDHGAYLAMEWLEGEDLGQRLSRAPLSIAEALDVARGAAEGLATLHARGLVHRDVKPSNLFLVGRSSRGVRLLDLGVARAIDATKLTRTGAAIGTPAYMPPEQARGEAGGVDPRADVYALGCVLFELVARRPPFTGEHAIAVLAKALLEPAPPLASLCPGAPRWLASLVDRMLAKDPEGRPPDARAVADAIDAAEMPPTPRPAKDALGRAEQRVLAILLAGTAAAEDATLLTAQLDALQRDARSIVESHGGEVQLLADGSLLATFRGRGSPVDAAAAAARCGLALTSVLGSVAIATGKAIVGDVGAVGEVIDRVARIAAGARGDRAPVVRVDDVTCGLVEPRFVLERTAAQGAILASERLAANVAARKLLGKPTRCVGRDRELASLAASLDEVREEPVARSVLVTAPAGTGKSRVAAEAIRAAHERGFEVIAAQADGGGAFALASRVLAAAAARMASSEDGAIAPSFAYAMRLRLERVAPGAAARLVELLAEIAGHPLSDAEASPALRALRGDAMTLADALRGAWEEWLAAECAAAPVLLALDDLHVADLPTIKLVDGALRRLARAPLMVLAAARPEVHEIFPRVWAERDVSELRLAALTPRASERLVRDALGATVPDAIVRALVDRAAGHPFFLEELIRAVSEGAPLDALPEGVLGMVQARLDALGDHAKRLLRAGSVFGQTFWTEGVAALLGDPVAGVGAELAALETKEIVERAARSSVDQQTEWAFRHLIVRDAAYAMLTEADRKLAHRLCGEWLEAEDAADALTIATHLRAGGDDARALPWLQRAADQALDGGDFASAIAHAEGALACGPDETARGALLATIAEARYWSSELREGERVAIEASRALDRGSAAWFSAIATACACAGQRGENARVAELVGGALDVEPRSDAVSAKATCLARAACQLLHGTRPLATPVLDALADLTRAAGTQLDPLAAAWARRPFGDAAYVDGRLREGAAASMQTAALFERAGAARLACIMRLNGGGLMAMAGDVRPALASIEEGLAVAERLGSAFLRGYGLVELALAHAQTPDLGAVTAAVDEALAILSGHVRLSTIAQVVAALTAMEVADFGQAEKYVGMQRGPGALGMLRATQLAVQARWLVHAGKAEEARTLARDAAAIDLATSVYDLFPGVAHLALSEAEEACGDHAAAAAAARAALERLLAVPEALAAPELKRAFLEGACPNRAIVARARACGVAV